MVPEPAHFALLTVVMSSKDKQSGIVAPALLLGRSERAGIPGPESEQGVAGPSTKKARRLMTQLAAPGEKVHILFWVQKT